MKRVDFSNKKWIKLSIILFEIVIISLSFLLLYIMILQNEKLYISSENRLKMIKIADRLRHSSDDLTNFARSYVVTNNKLYKKNYFKILDIRNGKATRPLNYESIYWDLNESIRTLRHPDTIKISLKEIINKLPFTKEEINKLKMSEVNSNNLVNLEIEAFNAMVGKFKDRNGKFTIISEPNQTLAINLMYSNEYYKAKHKIMNPIDEFMILIDERTKKDYINMHNKLKLIFYIFILVVFILIIGNIGIYNYLTKRDRKLFEILRENEALLFQQSKMASMGEMINAIAHQWKQPLNTLSIICQNISIKYKRGILSEEDMNNMKEKAKTQINFMSQTIDDFRNFFKPSKEQKKFLVSEAINEVYKLLEAKIKYHNIKFVIHTHEHLLVLGYPNEFKQVILNIINNAVDVFDEKNLQNGEINIFIRNDEKVGTISIQDNGGGIKEEMLNKIFEPYFTTKGDKGTGIGLQISKSIIETKMKGKLSAKNTNIGAEFKIELPIYNEKK